MKIWNACQNQNILVFIRHITTNTQRVEKVIHIGLFEGIGGFSLAARWMGWETLATCEIAEFPQKVLRHHFPNAYHHDDIHTLTYETINTELTRRFGSHWRNDDVIVTGGFP